ncbi:type IV pilus biogenesis/stability protein PilW [Arsukibacterium tuosuense]|uniref:Type IV pilus biogenesis/stability protein PilW n=1 Tax=Arsukibacterium tuosuense TaxID=1323745 RepID=A0A285JCF9_9GAMM|nr:type IV pilus biogenesis/stability protein PilW [Arsukibacterium tuosuense]SNY57935.1 type IV pilus biogenesis/stability protein PilW [Arsukibacterium tuosuense]
MQKFSVGLALCMSLTLTACVSQSSYVGSDRQVGERTLDNSEAARTRISLGLNYLRRGDTTQAKYNLERAKAFAPDLPEVYNALAFYYQSVGEQVQAEEAYKQALDKDSNNADAYNNYGAFLCQVGKYDEAEELLLKAISRPGYIRVAESYENLALCQLDQQGFSKAKTFLESSVSHNGTRISSLINLAALNYAMGDNVGAKTSLQKIQRLGRVSARSTLLNYLVAEKQGDVSTMKHAEQLLLTLYIDTPEARLLLQQRLLESEFEQLREQYKLSLMANIVMLDGAASEVVTSAPVANPRLRVVRRKTAEPAEPVVREPDPAAQALSQATEQQTESDQQTSESAATSASSASSVSSQAIAGALSSQQPTEDEAAEKALAQRQQAEQQAATQKAAAEALVARQLAEQQAAEQQAAADALAAKELAEQQAAADALAAQELAAQQATEQQAADNQPAQQQAAEQQAEQDAASQLVLAATPPLSLPAETVLTESAPTQTVETGENASEIKNETESESPSEIATVSQPAAQSEAQPEQVATAAQLSDEPATFHVVQEGESLYAISVAHNIRLARLMQWNQLTPESVIKTGQRIWLAEVDEEQLQQQQPQTVARLTEYNEPIDASEPYHQVAAGETMFGISYRYNIRLERFMAWNNLTEQSKLQVGQQVLVIDPARIEP